ncbi:hypothetical protein Avbf_19137 [Armadillidium vulgare]|nr:hypothetical protein Avbf_19137 [Armadillidium vulgare]
MFNVFGANLNFLFITSVLEPHMKSLPKNIQTSGFVSTTHTSSLALGSFIGPLIGGYIFETFGFLWGSHLFILYHIILCLVLIIYRFCFFGSCKPQLRDNTELEPLGENKPW